jgi:regulator of sigma E protease
MDVLIFVGAIAALIIVHEFGHFAAARLLKVDVEEFGLGFPPRLVKLFSLRGTDYTLNWVPLGGFVRLKGENDPDVEGGFASAKPLTRIAVLLAGPLMNIAAAIILYATAFSTIGVSDTSRVLIMGIAPDSPAQHAGLLSGDMLVSINGEPADSITAVQQAVRNNLGIETEVIVDRNGQLVSSTLVPRTNPPEGQGAIGIDMGHPTIPINVFQAIPYGAGAVGEMGYTLLTLPMQIANGVIAPEDARLVGFKGMYDIFQEVKEVEMAPTVPPFFNILLFFAMISTSLGILNLLPIPALDGGRILFTLPQLILGRRIPHRLETAINAIGFVLLLALLIYINLQDFINPIQLSP